MLQNYYPEKDRAEIQKAGQRFHRNAGYALHPGNGTGPCLSGFGVHLVYVNSIIEPPPPVFAEVRERVTQDWTLDRGEELNDQFYASLREQYTIVIEEPSRAMRSHPARARSGE